MATDAAKFFSTQKLRPRNLEPLFVDVMSLAGVGPTTKAHLGRLLGKSNPRLLDLLGHLPFRRIELRPVSDAEALEVDSLVTLEGTVGEIRAGRNRRQPSRITFQSLDQTLDLVFFGVPAAQLEKRFPQDAQRILYGRLSRYRDRWQIAHPEIIDIEAGEPISALPVYPAIDALPQWRLRRLLQEADRRMPELPEWLDQDQLSHEGWPSWGDAITALHHAVVDPADLVAAPRQRLAFDELLANQLALAILRPQRQGGRSLEASGALGRALVAALPFPLTQGQSEAIEAIITDMARPEAMRRLLQGDVGAGKTLVALAAMLQAVEAGTQAVLMAPTEVLAEQHAATIAKLLEPLDLRPVLLTG
ncbi:MAG: DEAD/DEAH box helicase, partial [Pseudomonadota bacterium]